MSDRRRRQLQSAAPAGAAPARIKAEPDAAIVVDSPPPPSRSRRAAAPISLPVTSPHPALGDAKRDEAGTNVRSCGPADAAAAASAAAETSGGVDGRWSGRSGGSRIYLTSDAFRSLAAGNVNGGGATSTSAGDAVEGGVKPEPMKDDRAGGTVSENSGEPGGEAEGGHPEANGEERLDQDENNAANDNDDDEEEEDNYQPREPSYDKANSLPFSTLTRRLEKLWLQRKKTSNKQSKEELLNFLLPPKLMSEYMAGTSPFPVLRLILPEIDTSRPHNGMKEKTIATAWGAAMGLGKESHAHQKLLRFNDPAVAGPTAVGDLSVALKEVMEERYPTGGSGITIGRMNELLDELAEIKNWRDDAGRGRAGAGGGGSSSHDWRSRDWRPGGSAAGGAATAAEGGRGEGGGGGGATGPGKGSSKNKAKRRITWVEKLIQLNLSPIEHKWVVRILLQKLEIGVGWKAILKHYHPWADDLYSANNSLKRLCQTLSDPEWIRRREERERRQVERMKNHINKTHMPRSPEGASLGHTIAPMLSGRTSFATALKDLSERHRGYAQSLPEGDPSASSLALKFPTFVSEVKLDGERMIIHIKRGVVTMQTRNATWYSKLYSPILGPALRRAISKYDVDCILDGEIVAWDDAKKEVIPFGNNRTVAKIRRDWCQDQHKLDDRDLHLHENETDVNVMSISMSNAFDRSTRETANLKEGEDPGSDCWLKFVLFDILYVSGPGSPDLLEKSCSHLSPEGSSSHAPLASISGSITNLDGFQRKSILYELITPQPNEVEMVDSTVICSDGQSINAADYFSPSSASQHWYPPATLDSIECMKYGVVSNLAEIDKKRRNQRKDEEIEQERAQALERTYTDVVERQHQEGLLFKDLAAPYVFGEMSRRFRYWFKFKADYEKLGYASDIDVVVLGANYATGLGKAGLLSHFLIGCIDQDSEDSKLMTLGRCSGGGTARKNLEKLLEITGFKAATATTDVNYGKWFKCQNHGRSVPDFVSKRSFQRSMQGDNDGWKFNRDKYPDVWINPEDSFVLTVNAAEICASDDYQAGVTLRFPRIRKVRVEGIDDAKPVLEAETVKGIQDLYFERQKQMQTRDASTDGGGQRQTIASSNGGSSQCRFLTLDQHTKKKQRSGGGRSATQAAEVQASRIPTPTSTPKVSKILEGYKFTVLEGTFNLEEGTLDAQEASEQGWQDDARLISSRNDVIKFIQKHSGTCVLTGDVDVDFIVGGKADDARVANYRRAIESASLADLNDKSKKSENLRKMVQMGGVVKWTFIFAAVYRMLEEIHRIKSEDGGSQTREVQTDLSIKEHKPSLLQPKRFDFLVLSKVAEEMLLRTEDEWGVHLFLDSNDIDFRRALGEVGRSKKRKVEAESRATNGDLARKLSKAKGTKSSSIVPWQYRAYTSLGDRERWVFSGNQQKLWPHTDESSGQGSSDASRHPCVLYPDIFGTDLGLEQEKLAFDEASTGGSKRWDQVSPRSEFGAVASSLPLAKAMGAQVTPHLHNGVTHVLVEMPNIEKLEWRPNISKTVFADENTGEALHYRLRDLDEEKGFEEREGKGEVLLVSPQWLRRLWSEEM